MNRVIFEGVLDGIVVDRIIRDDEFSMPTLHFHPEFEIYYLLDGARYYFIENKTYPVAKGSLVLVDTMQIHKTSAYRKPAHDRFLIELTSEPFSGFFESICGITLQDFFAEHAGILELDEGEQRYVESMIASITDEFSRQRAYYQNIVMMKIAELLIFAARRSEESPSVSAASPSHTSKHTQIHSITAFISENYDKVKSLDEVCKRFYISKSYLCRIFKEVTGFTVQEYINMQCIKKAQELLEHGNMNVSEIACTLGYGTVTHFERMFRKYTETTPLKYRRKMRLIRQKVRERKAEKDLEK